MNSPLLSVIIPVYNAEKYLRKCVNSIISQTYTNLEIILINDGSSDNSLAICDEFKKNDERITLFNYEYSQGAAKARKKGIELSKGDYITYVDSDDWIELNMFETLMKNAISTGADVSVSSGTICEYEGGNHLSQVSEIEGYFDKNQMKDICRRYIEFDLTPTLWNKVFKNDFHKVYQNKMDDRIFINNDIACLMMTIANAESIVVSKHYFYHYWTNPNSIIHTYKDGYLISNCLTFFLVMEELKKNNYDDLGEVWAKRVLGFFLDNIRYELSYKNKKSIKEKFKHIKELKNYRVNELLCYSYLFKEKKREYRMCQFLINDKLVFLYVFLKFDAFVKLLKV